ncbi:MAG: hypothetical protein FJ100_02645 [Deltaproteobacteria bacterium]|nr:hypothetical protein [Deltaproteobacteria bacterium]
MRLRVGRLIGWALLVAGCASEPAPEPITDFSKWLWRNYDGASDDQLANAVVQLHGTVTEVTADKPLKVLISRLSSTDVALVGSKLDASKAVGMLAVTETACSLAQIANIHTHADQAGLHPKSYRAYKRTFVQDRAAFLAKKAGRLDWDTELTSDYASENLRGSARWVPDLGKAKSPFGAALVSRTFLKEPATEVDGNGVKWPQDYQVEAYYERSPGRAVHLFALWRQADFGISTESSALQNLMLSGFVDWDKEVEAACKSGKY